MVERVGEGLTSLTNQTVGVGDGVYQTNKSASPELGLSDLLHHINILLVKLQPKLTNFEASVN